jgi:hypothetical protein
MHRLTSRRLIGSVIFFILLLGTHPSSAQDTCNLRISLLTCSPGEELYSTFGHTAIRVTNRSTGTDIVYNYGTFDFDDPHFYTKFVRGNLPYYLSQETFPDFVEAYRQDNRSVSEQLLDLSCVEKTGLQEALFTNMQEINRAYKYDYLFDNCTTRARDMILRNSPPRLKISSIIGPEAVTFRDHIHVYLDRGNQFWSKLGIDILLGSKLDRPMTNVEATFLPDFLEKSMDSTFVGTRPLIASKILISTKTTSLIGMTPWWQRPRTLLWSVLLAYIVITLLPFSRRKRIMNFADALLFLIIGLLGSLLLFLWTGTDQYFFSYNYNLLWAWPTHFIAAFLLHRNTTLLRRYFLLSFILTLITLAGWKVLPQQLHPDLTPIIILLAWRSFRRAFS